MKQHLQSNKKKSNNNVSIVESEEHRELQRNVSIFFYKGKVGLNKNDDTTPFYQDCLWMRILLVQSVSPVYYKISKMCYLFPYLGHMESNSFRHVYVK